MEKAGKMPLFKKGIWIKEQQGTLTMGSLDKNDKSVMVVPDNLCAKIMEFENDMMEALYGKNRKPFDPAQIDIEKLFKELERQYRQCRIITTLSGDRMFTCDYNEIYTIMKKFIESSMPDSPLKSDTPVIHINASVLQGHLCIIYRDSPPLSNPSKLKDEIHFLKTVLKGEITYKHTRNNKAYYDIMIPSKT